MRRIPVSLDDKKFGEVLGREGTPGAKMAR